MNDIPELILECGINHNGGVEVAKQMIDMGISAARSTGYPLEKVLFKFQKRTPKVSVPRHQWDVRRVSPVTGEETSYIEYKEQIEFGRDEYDEINDYTLKKGVWFFCSVWDTPSIYFLQDYESIPYIKIPSAHLTNDDLILAAEKMGKPLIISTGMSTKEEIDHAVSLLSDSVPLVLMACTAVYPCPSKLINLSNIEYFKIKYTENTRVGFSSHSVSPMVPVYSWFFGAEVIEVHTTLDRTMPGSDHAASLEQKGIELLMRELLRLPKLIGNYEPDVLEEELPKRLVLRGY